MIAVPKPDGHIHLCRDYKVTVNSVLDVDQYPLPKPKHILAKYEINFHPTGDHGNADGLSRLPLNGISPEDTNSDPRMFNISQMEALPVTLHQLPPAQIEY